jgi:hypothetical protein
MKIKNFACIASLLLASLSGAEAQNTLAGWTFDNLAIGVNNAPQSSAGSGTATAIGLGGSLNVVSLGGSSAGGANSWQLSGWTTSGAIGSQGANFAASTVGYYQVQASFDIYATANAEANLLVQYTTEGSIWHNATITSAGTSGVLATNTIATNSLVVGSYIILTNNGTASWDNQVTVNLSGISGVDNNANFAIRIVNAATGTNCLDTTGAVYVNNTGTWTLDNVAVQGISFDTVAAWTFDNQYVAPPKGSLDVANNPIPAISNNMATAACMGFGTPANPLISSTFTPNNSTNDADITANGAPYSSTGPAGQDVWRLRGQPGNGWLSTQPIGSQGAEFDVSTVNYSNVMVSFDLYFTTQGEAKMCVLYTTDGWVTTNVANNLAYGANPTFIVTNSVGSQTYSANTVTGTYLFDTYGSIFFNNMILDFTGVPGVANNPNFAFRIVNAATGFDCVNYLGQPYNNNSGNCRLDNVAVNGQFDGQYAPTVTNSPLATVDGPFTNTFVSDPAWVAAIKSVYVNGVLVTNNAGYTVTSTNIVFTPSKASVLQASGLDNIVIYATGYTSAKVGQFVATGVAKKLSFTQPAGPSASGGTLTINPVIGVTDQYGNGTTNPYANMVVTASVSNSVAWTLGGSTVQSIVKGFCVFTDLTATVTGSTAVANAAIQFTMTGYTNSANLSTTTNFYSSSFKIGSPPVPFIPGNLAVIQIDTLSNNTTFSLIELKSAAAGQTNPVNIVPISATGTNALRLASAGSCGKLALSDDGTFLVFNAFQDGSAATPDETFNLNRAVGTLNYTNRFTSPVGYVSTSYGGSQARAACSPDNMNFLICDKAGLYVNSALVYEQNNVATRSFGGAAWVQTAKAAFPAVASLYQFNDGHGDSIDFGDPGDNGPVINPTFTPPQDPLAQDFYMITTNGGDTYSILYVLDQSSGTNGTSGVINKWSLNSDGYTWTAIGSWTNGDNGDTLFATTNGSGGVYLYYADGSGGTGGNSLIRLTDASVNGSLNITSSNVIYTASANTSIEGVTFVPLQTPYANELIPPPILTAQTGANVGSAFSIAITPDDSLWRSSITSIMVNGSILPTTAYDTTQAGLIVFNPAQSALLQTSGTKTIVISATGYSTNSIVQPLAAASASQLVITTQPTAPLGDGGPLVNQPVVKVEDIYGNVVTNTANITAAAVQNTWTLGGSVTVATAGTTGTATFAGLTAFSTNAVTGASISFTSGAAALTSSTFNIPAPVQSLLGGATIVNGKFSFAFTNLPGLSFSVLATNNLIAPVSTWPVVGTVVESPVGSGNYSFTNTTATNSVFYILRQP